MLANLATRFLLAILFLGAASFGYLRTLVYRAPARVDLTSIPLVRLDGRPLPRSAVINRPIVLNFWAPWCPPCREEMPSLDRLQQRHPEAAILGIENDPAALPEAQQFINFEKFHYALLMPNQSIQQLTGNFAGLPTTIYISRSGSVVHTVTGKLPERLMEHYLADATNAR